MDFAGKKVLIAGATGFLGTNLALALAQRGAHLRLTVHKKPLKIALPGAEIVTADLRGADDCAGPSPAWTMFSCARRTRRGPR